MTMDRSQNGRESLRKLVRGDRSMNCKPQLIGKINQPIKEGLRLGPFPKADLLADFRQADCTDEDPLGVLDGSDSSR
ncbi:MAG: hypothetical protein FWD68_21170 [Alphaproteobacteria bacterium]|nr:hypothetical protein [Alphaproteobacteria bacterium]